MGNPFRKANKYQLEGNELTPDAPEFHRGSLYLVYLMYGELVESILENCLDGLDTRT